MLSQTLSDDIELRGLWWLPETPERRVPGIVTFDGDGINLELFGVLREPNVSDRSGSSDPKLILGRAEGKLVTLYQALATKLPAPRSDSKAQERPPQLRGSTYDVLHMLVGAHFESEAEIQFTSLDASFTYLEEWMGWERIPFSSDEIDETYTATYSYPEAIEVRVRAVEAMVSVGSNFAWTAPGFRSMKLEHNALISIFPDEQKDLEWYQSTLRDCQNLLTLLVGIPVHPRWITAHVEGEYRTATPYGTIQGSVEVLSYEHSRPLRRELPPPWHWGWDDVLVPLSSVGASLEQLADTWYDKANLLRPVYTLFFSTLYAPDMYLTSEFLSLAQALETFHRRTTPKSRDRYFPKEEFKEYRRAMLSVLPEKARAILRTRLQFLNEYSLKERLDDLIKRVPYSTRILVTEKPDDFIQRVRDTRNYLTHFTTRKKAFTEDEYFGANTRLRLWLMVLLLLELDVDNEIIEEAATKFRRLRFPREAEH